jgi:hypothetical protein
MEVAVMAERDKSADELLKHVEQVRREDPALEQQLERYREDRDAYDKIRGEREAKEPSAPARGGAASRPSDGPRATVGRVR